MSFFGKTGSLSSPPLTPPDDDQSTSTEEGAASGFDIVSHYNKLLLDDPSLTPPIAAIESLVALLTSTPATTIVETLSILRNASRTLKRSVNNAMPIAAGTDLFQRYLNTTFQRPGALGPRSDFALLRNHLISNSQLFVQRAKKARSKIAEHALPFIQVGPGVRNRPKKTTTVITYGPSRVVSAVLKHAATASSSPDFNIICIQPDTLLTSTLASDLMQQVEDLRSLSIPVATVPSHSMAYTISHLSHITTAPFILVGASSILENGAIVSYMGTHQLALLAKTLNQKFYVACESYKVVRKYPLSEKDLPISQKMIRFSTATSNEDDQQSEDQDEAVDLTPPELITAFITENGVLTPAAVSEELIKLWF